MGICTSKTTAARSSSKVPPQKPLERDRFGLSSSFNLVRSGAQQTLHPRNHRIRPGCGCFSPSEL